MFQQIFYTHYIKEEKSNYHIIDKFLSVFSINDFFNKINYNNFNWH